jgi:pyruvate/2-oxoglutarate dehydrogenase complex dihydrolipoamide dehydrogenase (E3) component
MAELLKPDICVIGAGAGGLSVASAAAAFGAQVVLVERGKMGGDCLNAGCVPSKSLIASARRAHAISLAHLFGLDVAAGAIEFDRVREHVRGVVAAIAPNDSKERYIGLGVRVLEGIAKFVDPRTVAVGEAIRIRARRFVIATGSAPVLPPIDGLASTPHLTNETVFDLDQCPAHLVVIGAGAVGLELAQAFRRLGAEVTVLEAEEPLAHEEPECAQIVLDALAREGIAFRTAVTVKRVREVQLSEVQAGETLSPEQQPAEAPADANVLADVQVEAQTGEAQVSEMQSADAQTGEARTDETQLVLDLAGEAPSGGTPLPNAQASLSQAGETQSSAVHASEAQSSDVPLADVKSEETRADDARTGEAQTVEPQIDGTQVEDAQIHQVQTDEIPQADEGPPIEARPWLQVAIASADGEETIAASHILIAIGRRPNLKGLGLEAARIKYEAHGIVVDRGLKTTNKRVYAIGDVTGAAQFTHAANYHAGLVIRNALFRQPVRVNEDAIPRVIFTDPELAHVGLTEAQARSRRHSICVLRWPYRENDRAQAERETTGHIKVITTKKGRILGATIVGASAGELITTWSLAISQNLNIRAFAGIVVPYPTLAEIGKRAAITYFIPDLTSPWVRRIIALIRLFR